MVQAGWNLVYKVEMAGGFGLANCLANRHLLGDQWDYQVGDYDTWETRSVGAVIGNPPCSGFSLLSHRDFRGVNSKINACMHAFANYVSRVQPQIAAFESVQQAYTGGLELMRQLRTKVEENTGQKWTLHHVLHNAAGVGGAAIRKRYFWVVSRVPFGIDEPHVKQVPVLRDVIGDLQGLALTWEPQPYRRSPSWWAKSLRSKTGFVDCHIGRHGSTHARRVNELMERCRWAQGEIISTVARRYFEADGALPDSWERIVDKLVQKDWQMGFHQVTRWRNDRVARVITGSALDQVIHPTEDRLLTHREVARIQGFPDDWTIRTTRDRTRLHPTWGKGIPVQCGRWLGEWMKRSLEGNPGEHRGEPGSERDEYVINFTNSHRTVCTES
jgi:site-specific DNA-cytosine methylase